MFRTNAIRRLLMVTALISTVGPSAASASAAGLTFTFSPPAGPAGTVVTFSGSGCPHVDKTGTHLADGTFEIFAGIDTDQGALLARARFFSDADGNFTASTSPLPAAAIGRHRTELGCDTNDAGTIPGPDFIMTPGTPDTAPASTTGVVYRFSPDSAPAGTVVDVIGTGCPPQSVRGSHSDGVLRIWKGVNTTEGPLIVLKPFDALDSTGRFHFTFTVPSSPDIPLGAHAAQLGCTGGEANDQVFTLTAPPATPTTVVTVPPQLVTTVDQVQAIAESDGLPVEATATLAIIVNFLQHLFGG